MKVKTSVSIDMDMIKKARAKGINISGILHKAIRREVDPIKTDAPDAALQLVCTECDKCIDFGYYCEEHEKFFCEECEDKFSMSKHCKFDKTGKHEHLRIPSYNGTHDHLLDKVLHRNNKGRVWTPKDKLCDDCGHPWNSEYHVSDVCVNLQEDKDDLDR